VRTKQKGNGGHSKHHAQSDVRKEKGNGGHFLDKQKGKAKKSKWEGNTEGMEHTLQTNKRELGKQKGYGGHSKHHAQTDASKEKGNGGHFLEKEKGKAIQPQGGNETQRQWRTLSMETEANWGGKRRWKTL